MKAVRGLEVGVSDLRYPPAARLSPMELETLIATPNDMRLFYIAEAFRRGWLVEEVHGLCKIDPWFLHRIRRLVEMEQELIARSGEVREVLSNLPPSLRFPPLREGNRPSAGSSLAE
jgi:carbamoyl-phosphate synthase large subunit